MRTRMLVGVIVLALAAAACGETAATTTTSAPAVSTTTATAPPATTAPPPTTTTVASTTTTTTLGTTTTSGPEVTTVHAVVAYLQASFARDFESIEPPEGVLGPGRVVCDETGPISVGTVIACRLVPNTTPGFDLDPAGLVIYVLDETGRSAWSAGTDVPDTTEGLEAALASAGREWFCRDLMDPDVDTGIFSGVGRPADSAYFWSLAYWSMTGKPDRMDADGNGVPCETLHTPEVVATVLAGGPFG